MVWLELAGSQLRDTLEVIPDLPGNGGRLRTRIVLDEGPEGCKVISRPVAGAPGRYSSATTSNLRRTGARLHREAGAELGQTHLRLGQASVQTAEPYLGTEINLLRAVDERLEPAPWKPLLRVGS